MKAWYCPRLELGTFRQEAVKLAHAALLFGLVQLLQLPLKFIRTARNPQKSFLQLQAHFSHTRLSAFEKARLARADVSDAHI